MLVRSNMFIIYYKLRNIEIRFLKYEIILSTLIFGHVYKSGILCLPKLQPRIFLAMMLPRESL